MTGNFENFNDGAWNGDVPSFINGNAQVTWPFADVGNLYTTTKVVYLSPQFFGFDFGAAYEPNTANVTGDGTNGCNAPQYLGLGTNGSGPGIAGAGCSNLSSTSTADISRRKNTFDVAARYRGTFGPVGLAAYVNYIGGGHILDSNTGAPRQQFDGLNVGVGGATVTVAGFSVGGLVQAGRFNGQWADTPKGEPDSFAWNVGASYTFGPFIVGASYFNYFSPGAARQTNFTSIGLPTNNGIGHQREQGAAAGGTYSIAPGAALFLSYLWGEKHATGYDFIVGSASPATARGLHNTVNSQALVLGTSFTW